MDKDKLLIAKVSDKIKQYKKNEENTFTSFMNPEEQVEAESILKQVPHILYGGYDDAERKLAIIGTDELTEELPIYLVRITSNEVLTHRNVLGSLIGLGVSRDKIGDILINEKECDVIVQKDILKFILNEFSYVGREKVKVRLVELTEIVVPQKESKELVTTVASLRLDAIISSALGISREKSCILIESEKVNLNYRQITSVKKQIACGDLISIRGHGRIVVAEILGESKSGRIKIKIKKIRNGVVSVT